MPVLTLIRVVLAAVFAAAAVGKLSDLRGSSRAMEEFGVPARFAATAGTVLPVLELMVATALLVSPTARWGALAALALLVIFAAVIARTILRGKAPDCNCFGQIHSAPAGRGTLLRNVLLAGLAAVLVFAGTGPSASAWVTGLSGIGVALVLGGLLFGAAIAIQAWFLLGLLRQHGRLMARIDRLEQAQGEAVPTGATAGNASNGKPKPAGLAVGTKAPDFALDTTGTDGPATRDGLLAAGRPLLLVFSDPGCGACATLLPEIGDWQRNRADTFTVALLSAGTNEEHRARSEEHGIGRILLDADRRVARSYGANGTPAAVLIDIGGRIASPLARGAGEVRLLAGRVARGEQRIVAARGASDVWAVGPGGRLPSVRLSTGTGSPSHPDVDLSSASGRRRIVIFWHGHCPYCRRMVSDLQAWEQEHPTDAPELYLVTAEPVREDPALALSVPLLEDTDGQIVRAAGARSTPTALLLDENGRVASELQVGAPAIMGLARKENGTDTQPASELTVIRGGR